MKIDPSLENVSRETHHRLKIYLKMLLKWNTKINLVSKSTIEEAWTRHFLDSAQLVALIERPVSRWLDIGSGGGFPGMVVAIVVSELRPETEVVMIESDQRKCAFLKAVLRETGVSAGVHAARIDDVPKVDADVISARALANLSDLLAHAQRHGSAHSTALFAKGRNWKREVSEAQTKWRFKHQVHQSKTDAEAVILRIEEIEHA